MNVSITPAAVRSEEHWWQHLLNKKLKTTINTPCHKNTAATVVSSWSLHVASRNNWHFLCMLCWRSLNVRYLYMREELILTTTFDLTLLTNIVWWQFYGAKLVLEGPPNWIKWDHMDYICLSAWVNTSH